MVNGETVNIQVDNLKDFVGPARFTKDRLYTSTPPGTVAGLAWTSMGGATLYVETAVTDIQEGKGALKVTGNIKEVMQGNTNHINIGYIMRFFSESTSIAYTVAKNLLNGTKYEKWLNNHLVHIHFPEGATPKVLDYF